MSDSDLTVLVVDDQADIRFALTEGLEMLHDCCVYTAQNGAEALETLQTSAIDVMLVDILLPDVNGLEFLKRVCGDETLNRPRKIVVMSGLVDASTGTLVRELGGDGVLPKPFSLDQLDAAVTTTRSPGIAA
ncbi:MAG: response regulator [Chloroflexota bacterium]